jgi:TetR/AcrR family transcriptional regulator, cholesterol catabolism regulator
MTAKEKIIETAIALFLRSGIRAITMDDISREAGVSKRTIYENFKDKDDLLRNCLIVMDVEYTKEHEAVVQQSDNIIQIVFGLMKLGIKAFNQINPLFFDDLRRYHTKVWKEVYTISTEKQQTQTLTILRKGINQGVFRKEIDLEIVTILLREQLRIMPDKTIFPHDKFSQSVIFENVIINFFRGIATKKGLDLIDKLLSEK